MSQAHEHSAHTCTVRMADLASRAGVKACWHGMVINITAPLSRRLTWTGRLVP